MADKKRIAFVIGSMGRGGAEKVVSILSNYYSSIGWDVDIIMLLASNVDYKLDPKINIININDTEKSRWKMLPFWIKGVRNYIKTKNPTVIVPFAARISIISLFANIGKNVPMIISERNDPKADTRGKFAKLIIPFIYPKADKIIFQTEYAKSCFNKKIKSLGEIIYNPVEIKCYAQAEKKKKIVSIGRLSTQKNQKMLINAFNIVLKSHPEYKLHIFGEGVLRKELQNQINCLGLEEKIILEGNVLNIHERIKDAEIFVLSSDFEGLSNAMLEAMMMGLPCISTKCAGATEMIKNNKNGLLVDVDNINEMTKAINKLIENKVLATSLGQNAKQIEALVSKENVINKWCNVIESVIMEKIK